VDERDLNRFMRRLLPLHMVPAVVVEIERVPLTPNGKVDRRALPTPCQGRSSPADRSPRDALEVMLVEIWSSVLNRKDIGVDDNFFALGGYSLLATRVFALIERRTGKRLPISTLFENPTIAELADAIRVDGADPTWSSLVPIQAAGSKHPFFYVAPYMISVLQLAELGEQLGCDQPLYGLQPQGLDGRLPPHERIEDMAAHYIAELKSVQPNGPYAVGGHCSGSWVAFEMARQLEANGDELRAVIVVDQGPPGVERPKIRTFRYLVNRTRFYFRDGRLRYSLAWQFKIVTARFLLRRVGPPTARFEETVREVHRHAVRRYGGGRIKHDITLVRSAESLVLDDKSWYVKWGTCTEGALTTMNVDGTHANLLVRPFVVQLASSFIDALEGSDAT
jgi:thioesterase domain-containing protein